MGTNRFSPGSVQWNWNRTYKFGTLSTRIRYLLSPLYHYGSINQLIVFPINILVLITKIQKNYLLK